MGLSLFSNLRLWNPAFFQWVAMIHPTESVSITEWRLNHVRAYQVVSELTHKKVDFLCSVDQFIPLELSECMMHYAQGDIGLIWIDAWIFIR